MFNGYMGDGEVYTFIDITIRCIELRAEDALLFVGPYIYVICMDISVYM